MYDFIQKKKSENISKDIFKNATYSLNLSGKNKNNPTQITMTGGNSKIGDFTICSLDNSAINQKQKIGIAVVYCNYSASFTDIFLVTFKNLDSTPAQTDAIDLRKHSDLKSHDLDKVSVENIALDSSNVIAINILVVPESLKDAPEYQKSATEPVTIKYQLDNQGKLITKDQSRSFPKSKPA